MITVNIIGMGYVGKATLKHILSCSTINKKHITFNLIDTKEVLFNLNSDVFINRNIRNNNCNLITVDEFINQESFNDKELFILCVPTDYKDCLETLDTTLIQYYLNLLKDKYIIIRSTLSLDFALNMSTLPTVAYVPEFLREYNVSIDYNKIVNLVGSFSTEKNELKVLKYVNMLFNVHQKTKYVDINTATTIKLATNAYLSMRLVFFKQLNNIGEQYKLNKDLISLLCQNDNRIGDFYNEAPYLPKGKCLPKDTLSLYNDTRNLFGYSEMSILEHVLPYQ